MQTSVLLDERIGAQLATHGMGRQVRTIAFLQSGLGHHLMSGMAFSADASVNSSYLL